MSAIHSLNDLLLDEIRDLYHAENQLVKALPKMAAAASNRELKAGFREHLKQTRLHVLRLKRVAKLLGAKPDGKTCPAMLGLVKEGDEAIKMRGPEAVRDACLIGAAQRVEHYEMAAYSTARDFAHKLGLEEVAALLHETFEEESATSEKLHELSPQVNDEAANADGDEE